MPRCSLCHRRLAGDALCPVDGYRAKPVALESLLGEPPPEHAGATVLGVGGFATTWRVGARGEPPRALKWSRRASRAAAERFAHEASALDTLHGSVGPALFDRGEMSGRPYLLLEYIEGRTLGALLEGLDERMDESRLRELGLELVRALSLCHGSGVLHGDLKPDNIMQTRRGIRLIDFGLARLEGVELPFEGAGTPEYAAPEGLRGLPLGAASDVYSLGVLFYELATMRLPFVGDNASIEYEHTHLRPPRASLFAPVSTALDDLLQACLEKEMHRRPTLKELSSELGDGERTQLAGRVRARGAERRDEQVAFLLSASSVSLSAPEVEELALEAGARVIDHWDGELLLAWLGGQGQTPLERARACASSLESQGATRLCLHLDRVTRVRAHLHGGAQAPGLAGRRNECFVGDALSSVESWRPAGEWSGLRMAPSLEHVALTPSLQSSTVGRDEELLLILEAAQSCIADENPTLLTVRGSEGMGKTRLMQEARSLLETQLEELTVVELEADTRLELDEGEGLIDLACSTPLLVLADDLESMRNELLDLIEYASMARHQVPLLLLCSCSFDFESQRPSWGARAGSNPVIELGPLELGHGKALFASLLHPAEYVPDSALERLARMGGGHPRTCYELAATLHREGYVSAVGGSYQLDTSRLGALPATATKEWLASHQLMAMPAAMGRLLCLCAELLPGFSAVQLGTLVSSMERSIDDGLPWPEAGVALVQWQQQGILDECSEDGYRFADPALRKALAARNQLEERVSWHRLALELWDEAARDGRDAAWTHLAHHAAACGDRQRAAAALLQLGREAQRCHRPVAADESYARALELLGDGSSGTDAESALREEALAGRGWAAYRMDGAAKAVEWLEEATSLAHRRGAQAAAMSHRLELCTALDWAQRFDDAEAELSAIEASIERSHEVELDAALEARLRLAQGRCAYRRGELEQAIQMLEDAAEGANAAQDFDGRVVSLLLLAPALVLYNELAEAELRFDEVMELCAGAKDLLHLCVAHSNRMLLWSARKEVTRARDDLREAVRLARIVGHPMPERAVSYNLAEDLYWAGDDDEEALSLAQESQRLVERFVDQPVAEDTLLVARVALASGRHDLVDQSLRWCEQRLSDDELSASARRHMEMLRLARQPYDAEAWQRSWSSAQRDLVDEELSEVRYWYARRAMDGGDLDTARQLHREQQVLLDEQPIWRLRFEELASWIAEAELDDTVPC